MARFIHKNGLKILQFDLLEQYSERITHFSTTRQTDSGDSFCMGFATAAEENPPGKSRERLAEAMGITPQQFVFCRQTHSNHVAVVNNIQGDMGFYNKHRAVDDTDGLITFVRGICVVAQSADCVPILLFHPGTMAVAAIHSGWRGTAKQILKRAIERISTEKDVNPCELICCIGPSAGSCCYEVGEDVKIAFNESGKGDMRYFKPLVNGKYLADLWAVNAEIAKECGLPENNIEVAGICTICNSHLFHSARTHRENAGRMSTGIMVR